MATHETGPAKRTYCVWADFVRRVCQHVEAESPMQAWAIAKEEGAWDFCHERPAPDCYRLSDEVQDLETEAFHRVQGATHCKTCGSELVETINDGQFRDGECGGCEYERYRAQPALLKACEGANGALCALSHH